MHPRAKIIIDIVKWGIDWYWNEWVWPLFRGRLRSCQPLPHIRHWIFRNR